MTGAPVALVTGASKRIGRAIAFRLHKDGYALCLHCNSSKEAADSLASELNGVRPASASVVVESFCANPVAATTGGGSGDASLEARCERVVSACYDTFGRCDVLVNNASAYYPTPLTSTSSAADDAADIFGSNAIAPFYLVRVFARRALEAQRAAGSAGRYCIVNMVDAMTNQPLLGFTVYTMAKHALEGLTKSAAVELAPHGIRVVGVAPGLSLMPPVLTDEEKQAYRSRVPLGQREATGEEIASTVGFLVSDEARYITGSIVHVDGAWSLTRA